MGVKNVVNIPSEKVESALSLSPEEFKVKKHVTLQHQRCNVESVFSSVAIALLLPLITYTVLCFNSIAALYPRYRYKHTKINQF